MKRQLVYYPDPNLRVKAHEVSEFNVPELQELTQDMRQIMKDNIGMGLAAPQVGDPRRIIIVEYPGDDEGKGAVPFTVLINPKIISKNKETNEMNEGCLSIPYVEVPISRATSVTVAAQDISGKEIKIKAKGVFARILQHEIDHLNGKLILDYEKKVPAQSERPRTIVWGSTPFTTTVLNTIRESFNVTHIVTEPAKPSGRKRELTPTAAKQYADTLGIPTLEPHDLQDPRLHSYLLSLKPDLMIVAAYGRLIPEQLYTIPHYGSLNVHPSLLPKYRGATPIQSALIAGDKQTGVSIMKLAPQFDTGEILAEATYDLQGNETFETLEYDLAELGGVVLEEILPDYLAGRIKPIPQDPTKASSTKKISRSDCWLNMDDPSELNERKIRAYYPEPGAFVVLNGNPVKVVRAHIEQNALVFDEVQPAGKKIMTWKQFLHGYRKEIVFDKYTDGE